MLLGVLIFEDARCTSHVEISKSIICILELCTVEKGARQDLVNSHTEVAIVLLALTPQLLEQKASVK